MTLTATSAENNQTYNVFDGCARDGVADSNENFFGLLVETPDEDVTVRYLSKDL
jgi:hypothetical protein